MHRKAEAIEIPCLVVLKIAHYRRRTEPTCAGDEGKCTLPTLPTYAEAYRFIAFFSLYPWPGL